MLQCPVEWRSNPVVLHVSSSQNHNDANSGKDPSAIASASPSDSPHSTPLPSAHHVLFFSLCGGPVKVAPLTVIAEERKRTAAVVEVSRSPPSAAPKANTADLPGTMASSAAVNATVGEEEEWTDAVDEEAMAFFGEDGN